MTARFRIAPVGGPVVVGVIQGHGGPVPASALAQLRRQALRPPTSRSRAHQPSVGTWTVFPFYCAESNGPGSAVPWCGAEIDVVAP